MRAAVACGLGTVPVAAMGFASKLDEREAIIAHNRHWVKTFSQRMREAEAIEAIERARERMLAGKRIEDPGEQIPYGRETRKASEQAAQVFHTNPHHVSDAKRIAGEYPK